MRKYISFILFFTLFSTSFQIFGQQPVMDSITRKFKDYRKAAFQEKLFVHIDQDFYLTGEILWFRIFSVDGTLHKVNTTSKVAFIEILDKSGIAVVQTKVPLDVNGGQGSLFIPATLNTGNYVLRVYTQWMRNFSADHYFQKGISIVNPFVKPDNIAKPETATTTVVEFFPEGGHLVHGLRSRVGFKASNFNGESVTGRGALVRNESDTVATFETLKFGLGSFHFTPSSSDRYKCVFEDDGGNTSNHALPKIQEEGYTLQVSDSTQDLIKVKIQLARKDKTALAHAYLFVHARNSIVLAEVKPIYPNEAIYLIPKANLPGGISHFTVFDQEQRPVCERLYFKAPSDPLELKLSTDQTSYSTRRKVNIDFLTSSAATPLSTDISVSVYRVDSLSTEADENIFSYLYLESDLKGYVESPGYYFSNESSAAAAADNLMLTHGWRKFNWENIINKTYDFQFIPEVRSHLITGKVTKPDGTPASGILTYLSSPGKLVNLYGARSNARGLVHFEVRDFWGSRKLIFQTNFGQDSIYTLSVNNPYDEAKSSYPVRPFHVFPGMEEKLSERSLSMQVQDIFYREAHDRIVAVKNDSTAFFGKPDETYNLDDYTRFPVMEEVMREYVPGVLVRKRRSGFHFIVLDKVNKGVLSGDPLVLLDGVPVFDVDQIMAFDPLKIKRLEVVTRNFYVGPLFLPGIVSYATYGGDLAGFPIDSKSVSINYEGLQLQREFYSPRYENQKQRNSRLPDQRTLLHWEPSVKTGADGKQSFDFYTSDTTGDFVIVAHGLAANGKAGTGIHKFTVRRNDF